MLVTVGIDEVGRGSWAGPVVAAAIILTKPLIGLNDSKLLSPLQRRKLAAHIKDEAVAIGTGWVSAKQVDDLGLTQAVRLAMQQALEVIVADYDEVIIDGSVNFLSDNPRVSTLVKADMLIPSVSAASIFAKVARDEYMHQMAQKFPEYYFERHVGYGTRLHQEALKRYGPCVLHRLSYKPLQDLI